MQPSRPLQYHPSRGESGGGKKSSALEAGKRLREIDGPGSNSEPLESSKIRLVESERGCSAVSEGDSSSGLYGPFIDVLRRQGSLAKATVAKACQQFRPRQDRVQR